VKFRKFGRLVVKFNFSWSLFSSLRPFFFRSGKRHKFAKIEKNCLYKPYSFVFKIHIPQDAMCRENFGRFHRKKFKKITNKAIKKGKNAFLGAFIIQD